MSQIAQFILLSLAATATLIAIGVIVRRRIGSPVVHRRERTDQQSTGGGRPLFRQSGIGWLLGAVLGPCIGIALALNHQLDINAAVLTFAIMPAGCIGTYFYFRWVGR